jgi:hypothetical protein
MFCRNVGDHWSIKNLYDKNVKIEGKRLSYPVKGKKGKVVPVLY